MGSKVRVARLRIGAAVMTLVAGLIAVAPPPARAAGQASTVANLSLPAAASSIVAPRLDWTEALAYQSPITQLTAVSCPTTTTCLAAADEMRRSTDGGQSWTAVSTAAPYSRVPAFLRHVACPSSLRCYALDGQSVLTSGDGGQSWISTHNERGLDRLSCPTESTCYGLTSASEISPLSAFVTRDGGASWTTLIVPKTTTPITAFTCSSELSCGAAGHAVLLHTDDGGSHWTLTHPSLGFGHFTALACPTTLDCIGISSDGSPSNVWHTADGGATWENDWLLFNGLTGFQRAVDCPSATHCVLVGAASTNGGGGEAVAVDLASGAVTHASVPAGADDGLDVISCHSAHCVAFGRDSATNFGGRFRAVVSDNGGVTFTAAAVPEDRSLSALACPTASHCVAVGQNGVAVATERTTGALAVNTDDGGATWTPGQMPSALGALSSIACSSSRNCVAVSSTPLSSFAPASATAIAYTIDGGSSWAVSSLPIGAERLSAPACTAEQVCVVGAQVFPLLGSREGRMLRTTDGGATWTVNASWTPAGPLRVDSIGCLGGRCIAVAGDVFDLSSPLSLWASADGGATWTAGTPPNGNHVQSVNCEASRCLLMTSGNAPEYIFGTNDLSGPWTALHDSSFTAAPWCTAAGLCAAFGNVGGGSFYSDTASTSGDGGATWTLQPPPAAVRGVFGAQCLGDGSRCIVVVRGGSHLGTAIYRVALRRRDLSAMVPKRLLDTRIGPDFVTVDHVGEGGGERDAGAVTVVPVAGRANLPSDSSSVALTVTVTEATAAGFVTVWPCGAERPTASNLNFTAGATVANTVVSKVSSDGSVCIYNQTPAQLVVDVDAFMPAGSSVDAVVPARLLDTRSGAPYTTIDHVGEGGGRPGAASVTVLPVAGRAGVPVDAAGAVLTVTVTDPAANGFVTVWPCGTDRPTASNLNHSSGATVANTVVSKLGNGSVCIFNQVPTHIVVDVDGFLAAGSHVTSLVPGRLFDSRSGPDFVTVDHQQEGVGKLDADRFAYLYVGLRAGVGFPVGSVVLTVTVTEPSADGFITIWSCEVDRPTASNLNYAAGQTVANTVVTMAAVGGEVCIYTKSPTHLVVDVNGYE